MTPLCYKWYGCRNIMDRLTEILYTLPGSGMLDFYQGIVWQ